jgi:hypothetical protein
MDLGSLEINVEFLSLLLKRLGHHQNHQRFEKEHLVVAFFNSFFVLCGL